MLHPLAEDYLLRLRRAGQHLPRDRRREMIADIERHLAEVAPPGASDHEVLEALERLGPPGDIVEAEQPASRHPTDQRGVREWAAVILLPLGGFAFGVGWLVGLILLWSSRLWTTRDKLIGTLVIPGGLITAVYASLIAASSSGENCSGGGDRIDLATGKRVADSTLHCSPSAGQSAGTTILQVALVVILILGPIVSAIYLARRARSAPRRLVVADR
jgi:uncharacterized membrane protein